MSNTEDYLDGLLNSMEGKTKQAEPEPEVLEEAVDMTAELPIDEGIEEASVEDASMHKEFLSDEDEFLDAFEREILSVDDNDEFIRKFEEELAREGIEGFSEEAVTEEEQLLNELDEVQSDSFGMPDDIDTITLPDEEEDIMIDTIGEDLGMPMFEMESDDSTVEKNEEELFDMGEESLMEMDEDPLMGLSDEMSGTDEEAGLVNEDQDLMDLLQSEGDFSLEDIMEVAGEEETPEEDSEEKNKNNKKEKKEKKQKSDNGKEASGFIQKLSQVLFGDDEDEEQEQEPVKAAPVTAATSIEDLSDESLMILQTLEGGGTVAEEPQPEVETEEEAKARKKLEKQEQKKKAKAERKEKKEAAKRAKAEKAAKKPKKVKKPKEPDNTPPLPKKPVILTFVMAASFLALVIIGTNLFGYSNRMSEAEHYYELGDYVQAYSEVSGLEIKENDIDTYQKYYVMGNVAGEFSAYQSFMESNLYDMALDSLIRTVGRCQKYQADAELYGCTSELSRLREQTTGALASFGLTEEQALEIYAIEDRDEYSERVYAQITLAGFIMD